MSKSLFLKLTGPRSAFYSVCAFCAAVYKLLALRNYKPSYERMYKSHSSKLTAHRAAV